MKKRINYLILISIIILAGCEKNRVVKKSFFLFNTQIKFVVYGKQKDIEKKIEEAYLKLKELEDNISGYKKESDIRRINENSGEYVEVSFETIELINRSKELSEITSGKYDITIKPIFKLWGFQSNSTKTIPAKNQIQEILNLVNYKNIKIKENRVKIAPEQEIDLSSFLKGYAIYKAREVLRSKGLNNFLISSISSIEVSGKKRNNPWKIGIQNPKEPGEIMEVLKLSDKAIGVSGDYQTNFVLDGVRYHHLLNANTGYPSNKNRMVVILAKEAYTADIYSTALFCLDNIKIMEIVNKKEGMEALVVDRGMNKYYSQNMKKYLK